MENFARLPEWGWVRPKCRMAMREAGKPDGPESTGGHLGDPGISIHGGLSRSKAYLSSSPLAYAFRVGTA